MANTILKEKAQILRKKDGLSIKEISDFLKINKSTVSYWCKNIFLTKKQIERLVKKQRELGIKGSVEHAEKTRKSRLAREKDNKIIGEKEILKISKRDLYILGLGLYWAEGYKKGNEEVGFTNSDPSIIKIMIRWFKDIFFVQDKDFTLRISINEIHKNRINKVVDFWSKYTTLPKNQFTKTSLIKTVSKKVYQNHENYFGVLRIKVKKGVNLRNRILGAIEFIPTAFKKSDFM